MRSSTFFTIRPTRLASAVSLALASLVASNLAVAQQQAAAPAPAGSESTSAASAASGADISTVTVVATRRSQQSSIERKKYAATAQDSIVASDVGTLPDRNIGEAISRIAGIALDRGDFGEGINVSVRGNGPELTRVELDGQAVASAGGTDMVGGGDGRGTEFRQLSSDLIKSVDVVKGATADMTEGSLGGGIIIKTRTGLDFDKPFVSVRVAATNAKTDKKWTPDLNVILSKKFMDNRLGILVNASSIKVNNESHQFGSTSNGNGGYGRAIDIDNSPEKTFTYHPETANQNDPAVNLPIRTDPLTAGGTFASATPYEILTKSAAAKTKADCLAAFPMLTADQLAKLNGPTARTNATFARGNEAVACLNQWNDVVPSLIRYVVKRQEDTRKNLDLRADYKVNNELTVYGKGSYSRRNVEDNFLAYNLGNANYNNTGTFTDNAAGVRSVVPGTNNFLYPTTYSGRTNLYPALGATSNIDPASVVIDSKHQVTKFTINDASVGTDQIYNPMGTTTRYLQLGGTYRHNGLTAEFLAGDSRSDFWRNDIRGGVGLVYGTTTIAMQPNGIWTYTFPRDYNFSDITNYTTARPATAVLAAQPLSPTNTVARPAYTIAQQPLTTPTLAYSQDPRAGKTGERTAKLDLTYAVPDSIPFIKRVKAGANLRDTQSASWFRGGYTVQTQQGVFGQPGYVAPIVVPGTNLRNTVIGCQDTPGSLGAGGAACQYGFVPSSNPASALAGQTVLTPQQFNDLLTAIIAKPATGTEFFNGASGRPPELLQNWNAMDVQKMLEIIKVPNIGFDCEKSCTANDGKVYDQPKSMVRERVSAFYLMTDFSIDHVPFTDRTLPFGWQLDGNIGYRYVRNRVQGTANTTFTSITKTAAYNPLNPAAAAGIQTFSVTKPTSLNATAHDFLPNYNLAMWVVPDQVVVRYSRARTVARPPVSRLISGGTCTYDERNDDQDLDMTCNTLGNQALKPFTNVNQNLSVEYYPNKDTMFTLSAYRQHGIIGGPVVTRFNAVPLFAGTDLLDPATGKPLSDLVFDYNTYVNGPAIDRKGVEFSMKTAFTFLPSILRNTGFDANYTRQKSSNTAYINLLTGEPLPPIGEPRFSYNWAFWYDDGRFAARIAVQGVAPKFYGFGVGGRYYSYVGGSGSVVAPYNPLAANWTDATRYVDGKFSFKYNPHVEFFIEGRNLTNKYTTSSMGEESRFASGTPYLSAYNYSGRRVTIGVNFRN